MQLLFVMCCGNQCQPVRRLTTVDSCFGHQYLKLGDEPRKSESRILVLRTVMEFGSHRNRSKSQRCQAEKSFNNPFEFSLWFTTTIMSNTNSPSSLPSWIGRFLIVLLAAIAAIPPMMDLALRKEFTVHETGAVLISGTSTGIGNAACTYLAEEHPGTTFYCGVRKREHAMSYPFTRDNVEWILLDVTMDDHVQNAIEQITEHHELVGIVNNAGINPWGTVEFLPISTYQKVFEVIVFGAFRLTQASLPHLRKSKGRVVNVGSFGGKQSYAIQSAYCGAKFALEAFTDSLRREVGQHGVSVSIIEASFVSSVMMDRFIQEVKDIPWDSPTKAMQAYPHLYRQDKVERTISDLENADTPEETVKAIDDALFGKFPRTRYQTAKVNGQPSGRVLRIFSWFPDRLLDALFEL